MDRRVGTRKGLDETRYTVWIDQAKRDLEVAKYCLEGGYYEWACFCSQESAVKFIKAALKKVGLESWRHSVTNLLDSLSKVTPISEELYASAELLDKHYVSARYPAAHHKTAPYKVYTKEMAEDSIKATEHISNYVLSLIDEGKI